MAHDEAHDMRRSAAILGAVLLAGGAAAAEPTPIQGAVGVCMRWGPDPDHVVDVVVVHPSGNPVLDAAIPDTIRQLVWPRSMKPKEEGAWVGIWMSVDGAEMPQGPLPTCETADSLLPNPQMQSQPT